MKRSLVAATAVALLLTGCATGDTGHLNPDIEPELLGPRSTPASDAGGTSGESSGEGGEDGSGEGAEGGTDGSADVEAAFEEAAGGEAWFGDVTGLVVDGDAVQVTTRLADGDADALAVCEAAVEAARSSGISEPSVEVVTDDGASLSALDATAGDAGCTS